MKDKNTAALLAFLLGGFGAHKFYLGKTTEGWWYLAALIAGFWTVIIPIIILIVCLIDAIKLFSMDDDAFNAEYFQRMQGLDLHHISWQRDEHREFCF